MLLAWAAVGYVATGFYTVGPNERAVVRRCGRRLPRLQSPGLHFGFPFGIDRITRVKPSEPKQVGVRASLVDRALGRETAVLQAECLTGDRNLILVPAIVQYQIKDSEAYVLKTMDVAALVRNVTGSEISSVISSMTVDDVLTVQRRAVAEKAKERAQAKLDRYGAGVTVTAVSLQRMRPPPEVEEAFRDVHNARADRQRAIGEADGYAKRELPRARGQARKIRYEAEAYCDRIVKEARSKADSFRKVAAEFADSRELTTRRLILETMEDVLPRLNKIILGDKMSESLDLGLIEERP